MLDDIGSRGRMVLTLCVSEKVYLIDCWYMKVSTTYKLIGSVFYFILSMSNSFFDNLKGKFLNLNGLDFSVEKMILTI